MTHTDPEHNTLSAPDLPPAVAHSAVEWILALQASDDPAQVRKRIRSWCARHPDHQRAWEHVEHLNRRFSLLTNSGCAPAARHALSTSVLSRRQALKALSLILVTGATGYSLDQSGMINH